MKKRKKYKTNKYISRTSIFDGFGTLFNITGNYYDFSNLKKYDNPDLKAIENDWGVIGNDIFKAGANNDFKLFQ